MHNIMSNKIMDYKYKSILSYLCLFNMSKQIFRKLVSPELLYELLEKICLKTDKYYLVDHNAYKKFMFLGLDRGFKENIIGYYHDSKRFYVTREMNYNSFINILRQVCKSNQMMFTSQIKYMESKYSIEYLIFYNVNH
jgi:hypothetical protein